MARSRRDSLPESREASGGPLEVPGGVRRPFWRAGMVERVRRGLEVLLEGHERSKSPPKRPVGIGRPSQRSVRFQESLLGGPGGVWRSFLWDGRGRDGWERSGGLSEEPGGIGRAGRVWEDLPDGQERLGGPLERGGRSWEALSEVQDGLTSLQGGWEALLEGQQGSGGPPGEPGGIGTSGRGWEALPESWEGSGGPAIGMESVGRPSQRSGSGQESLPEGQEESGGPPGGLGRDGKSPWRAGRVW